MTDQREDSIKVQIGEPMGFIGVIYRNTSVGEGFLTGAGRTQTQLTKAHPSTSDSSRSPKQSSLYSLQVGVSLQAAQLV